MLWKRFPGVVLFFFLALFLWPEPLQVDYLDGLLETRFSGGWQEVSIGETIHPGARHGGGAFLGLLLFHPDR
jgi:hypothetical protein